MASRVPSLGPNTAAILTNLLGRMSKLESGATSQLARAQQTIRVERKADAERRRQTETEHQIALLEHDLELKRKLHGVQCQLEAAQAQLATYRAEAKEAKDERTDTAILLHTTTQALVSANERAARHKFNYDACEETNKTIWTAATKARDCLAMFGGKHP